MADFVPTEWDPGLQLKCLLLEMCLDMVSPQCGEGTGLGGSVCLLCIHCHRGDCICVAGDSITMDLHQALLR